MTFNLFFSLTAQRYSSLNLKETLHDGDFRRVEGLPGVPRRPALWRPDCKGTWIWRVNASNFAAANPSGNNVGGFLIAMSLLFIFNSDRKLLISGDALSQLEIFSRRRGYSPMIHVSLIPSVERDLIIWVWHSSSSASKKLMRHIMLCHSYSMPLKTSGISCIICRLLCRKWFVVFHTLSVSHAEERGMMPILHTLGCSQWVCLGASTNTGLLASDLEIILSLIAVETLLFWFSDSRCIFPSFPGPVKDVKTRARKRESIMTAR